VADIEIVQPVEGAARVTFDYQAASDAIDALSAMGTKLSGQTEGRTGAQTDVVVHWAGAFRTQFDEAAHLLNLRFSAAIESAGYAQGQIYQAISDANEAQREINHYAQVPQPGG
jgi:hypothetical protein